MLGHYEAEVVRTLADLAWQQGAPARLVTDARRIAEKLEGRPKGDADLAARRRGTARFKAKHGLRAGVAAVVMLAGALTAHGADAEAARYSYAQQVCAGLRADRPTVKAPLHVACIYPGIETHFYCPEIAGAKDHRMVDAIAFSQRCSSPNSLSSN